MNKVFLLRADLYRFIMAPIQMSVNQLGCVSRIA